MATLAAPAVARVLTAALLAACGGASEMAQMEALAPASPSPASSSTKPSSRSAWASATSSPSVDVTRGEPANFSLAMQKCGREDAALDAVARDLASQPRHGDEELARTSELLRREGLPQVWPRVWIATAKSNDGTAATFDQSDLALRVERWRAAMPTAGERRCGTSGLVNDNGEARMVFVSIDALADLAPLPTRARTGTWLSIDASMRVFASSARVVVVGPDGRPRAVPTSFEQGRIRATFAPDRPGRFAVQVLADVGAGPRPVLEALVFADVEPFEDESAAPGESAASEGNDNVDALAKMIVALRVELGLPPLRRDRALDLLAIAHSQKMKAAGHVGHDVGDGDPKSRIQNANITARKAGENVAHAQNVTRAHRSLFKSPSHRENLIHPDFDRFGLAVVEDADGTVWVTEMFAQ